MTNPTKLAPEKKTLKTFKPLGDRVLILQHTGEEKTESGIIIPDGAKEKPLIGFVVALGTKVTEESLELNDVVYFGMYAGNDIKFNETTYLSVDTSDILGVLK